MKYAVRSLFAVAAMLLLSISAAFAAPTTKSSIMDDSFNLSSIHSIAVAMPNYIQTAAGPAAGDVTASFAQSGFDSRELKNITVIPYSVIASSMKRDTGTDLQTLDKVSAQKFFKQNISKYADTYLVVTIANDSRVVLFYDLYSAKTGAYLYSYEVIAGGQSDNNINAYKSFNGLFYSGLADSIKNQYKDKKNK